MTLLASQGAIHCGTIFASVVCPVHAKGQRSFPASQHALRSVRRKSMAGTRRGWILPHNERALSSPSPGQTVNLFETADYIGRPSWQRACLFNQAMTAPHRICPAPRCTVEIPAGLEIEGLCLQHYLEKAFHKLAAATLDFQCGRDIDYHAMEWLLAQVNFAVESLAQEDAPWDAEQRSMLLELILGIANLNEYMRHSKIVEGRLR